MVEQILNCQTWSTFYGMLPVHSVPRYVIVHQKKSKIAYRLQIIFSPLYMSSQLTVTRKRTSIEIVRNLHLMPLNINVPLCSFKVDRHKLPFLVKHKVLRLNITIKVPAFVYELNYFYHVYQNWFCRQPHNICLIPLHNYEIIVLTFVIVYTINARPMCFSNVFPHSFIYL